MPGAFASATMLGVIGCTDTVLDPAQVITNQGRHYEGHRLYQDEAALSDSTSGEPLRLLHVRLGEKASGDGTFETPFSTTAEAASAAQPRDIVLIHGNADAGIPGFTVPDQVRVLGASVFQTVNTRELGRITLPLTGSTPNAAVTGTVTLGSGSEIAGFTFNTETGRGIEGRDIQDVVIRHNRFSNTAHQGVYLINTTGTVQITDNEVRETQGGEYDPACQSDFASGGCAGIYLENHAGSTNLSVRRNTVFDTRGDGIAVVTTDRTEMVAIVDSNTVRGTVGSGIKHYASRNARLTTTVVGNVVSRNSLKSAVDGGIRLGAFDAIVATATVIGNEVFENRSHGLFIGTESTADVTVTVLDNLALDNVGNGVFVGAQESSVQRGVIANNIAMRNREYNRFPGFPTGNGFFVGTLGSGLHSGIHVSANRAVGNGRNGFFFATFNAGKSTLTVVDNIAANNTLNGMEFNCGLNIPPQGEDEVEPPLPPVGANQGYFHVVNNTITGNRGEGPPGQEGGGVMILSFNGSILNISMERNRINGNGSAPGAFAGLGILAFGDSSVNAGIVKNTMAQNEAAPAFNAQALMFEPLPGEFPKICLRLNDNVSDSGYLLNRAPGTEFRLENSLNKGPLIVQSLHTDPFGDCSIPLPTDTPALPAQRRLPSGGSAGHQGA